MKKLQQHTKAELISKLNELKSNNNGNNTTNFMTFLLVFKSFILKITLIAIIVKIFKKYSIIRRLFTIINTILFSIFGISMIDIYEIESLSKIFHKLIDIFSNFHSNILELFSKKVETPSKIGNMIGIQSETTRIQTGNDPSNKIIERFKQIIHNEQDQEIIQDENTPYYKNKYVIIAGMLILSGITWYYFDDLRPYGSSILGWINISRSWSHSSSDDFSKGIQGPAKSNLQSLKDWLRNKFSRKPKDDDDRSNSPDSFIELINKKGKGIDFNNLSQSELERRGLVNPQLTGLPIITGENTQFITEANSVLREIKTFESNHKDNIFPSEQMEQGFYNLLRSRLHKLSEANPIMYQDLIKSNSLNDRIDKFVDLENKIFANPIDHPVSNAYNDVEMATNQEQDIWSDKALSPQQPLSPKFIGETVMESIENDKPKSPLDTYWDKFKNFKINKDDKKINLTIVDLLPVEEEELIGPELFPELKPLKEEVLIQPTPHNSESPPSDMNQYFTKEEVKPEKPTAFASLLAQINAKRNETDVVGSSPVIENPTITVEVDPVVNKEAVQETKDPEISNLLAQINSRRLEYGTPNIASVGLPRAELSPINLNPASSSILPVVDNTGIDESDQDNSPQIENTYFKNIEFKINRGATKDRFIDMNFGEDFNNVSKVLIITNDGKNQYFDPHLISKTPNLAIKWDNFGSYNPNSKELDIFKIFILDREKSKSHEIYSNPTIKILDSYWKNRGKE